jgi:hypothetical protein
MLGLSLSLKHISMFIHALTSRHKRLNSCLLKLLFPLFVLRSGKQKALAVRNSMKAPYRFHANLTVNDLCVTVAIAL